MLSPTKRIIAKGFLDEELRSRKAPIARKMKRQTRAISLLRSFIVMMRVKTQLKRESNEKANQEAEGRTMDSGEDKTEPIDPRA
jgi:hypothetical protein